MRSIKSNRPQNLHPDALIRSREEVARRNKEAVRVTVQAMQRRGIPPQKITVQSVAEESGVSIATIYRQDAIFALLQKANPELQRRRNGQKHRDDLAHAQAEALEARKDRDYYKKKAEISSQHLQQEIIQLRKKNVDLQRENARLREDLMNCTCERRGLRSPYTAQ